MRLESDAVQEVDLVAAHDIGRGVRESAERERVDQRQVVADVREHQDHGFFARPLETQDRRMPRIEADELSARELRRALTGADQRGQSGEHAAGVGVGIRALCVPLDRPQRAVHPATVARGGLVIDVRVVVELGHLVAR